MNNDVQLQYLVEKRTDPHFGNYIICKPPHIVEPYHLPTAFDKQLNDFHLMYTKHLDLAIVESLTDEQLTELINKAQTEQQRRLDEVQTNTNR